MPTFLTPKLRQYLYSMAVAALPILVVVGVLSTDQVALWLGLAAAILGLGTTGTAAAAITRQRKDGTLE